MTTRTRIPFFTLILLFLLCVALSCATRGTYNTIAATHAAVKSSYDGYMDSVIRGETRTNDVPIISKGFNLFLSAERVAIDAAQGNTNGPVTADMAAKAGALITDINTKKGLK